MIYVFVHGPLVRRAGGEPRDVGMLGRHDEERRAEQCVGARGEDRVVDLELRLVEVNLGSLGAADPVALHRLYVLGPVERPEIVEQALRVVGDLEKPLLELADFDLVTAALAATVDHLLIGEDGLVVGAPVDRGLAAVGEAGLEELDEDPLRPAVVARVGGRELARPVDRDPPVAELALEGGDRGVRRIARMFPGRQSVVLGR